MEGGTEKTKPLKRQKSPNAPAYSLQECLEDARKIFQAENQVPVSREAIAEHLGLAAQSGPFNRKLSSLRQYGLLEPVGKDLRISELFLRIEHSGDEEERHRSLRETLRRPTIFQGLMVQYENSGLPSEMNLTNQLILKHKFTRKNAEVVAKAFLDSVRLVGGSSTFPPSPTNKKEPLTLQKEEENTEAELSLEKKLLPARDRIKFCRQEIPLGTGRRAVVELPDDITQEELAKVLRVLKALSDS